MEVVWTKKAVHSINNIVDYIAQDNYQAAAAWAHSVFKRTDQLTAQPRSGRIVPEYNDPDLREIFEGNYRIIYRIREAKNTVFIQVVLNTRQDPPKSNKKFR